MHGSCWDCQGLPVDQVLEALVGKTAHADLQRAAVVDDAADERAICPATCSSARGCWYSFTGMSTSTGWSISPR